MDVLEINAVRDVIEQCAQQITFVSEFFFDLLALGDDPENTLNAHNAAEGIVERALDDVHEQPVATGSDMRFNRVEIFERAHDAGIVALIFESEVARKKIEVGLAENFVERLAHRMAEFFVREREAALD